MKQKDTDKHDLVHRNLSHESLTSLAIEFEYLNIYIKTKS